MPIPEREWLGWTESDYIQLALILRWQEDPQRQGIEDSMDFLAIIVYVTRTRTKSA